MRICSLFGKKTSFGKSWSYTRKFVNNKARRVFKVNLQKINFFFPSIKKFFVLRISMHALRTVKKYNGIENLILSKCSNLNLTPKIKKLKRDILRSRLKSAIQQI